MTYPFSKNYFSLNKMRLHMKQLSRAGFVLAGGKSSRMGVDKAFLEFQGRTLLERALGTIAGVCPSVTIVGDASRFSKFGTVVEDLYRDCGPLAGIHAALTHSSADLNLILAVDLPFVSDDLLSLLFSTAEQSNATVIVPRTTRGFQPLCAVYRREFADPAGRALQAGKYKIDTLFDGVVVRVLEPQELEKAGFSERCFFNVNTPADRRTAEEST